MSVGWKVRYKKPKGKKWFEIIAVGANSTQLNLTLREAIVKEGGDPNSMQVMNAWPKSPKERCLPAS